MTRGVRIAASGIMLVVLTSCSSASSGGPAPEPFSAFVADGHGTVTAVRLAAGAVARPVKVGRFPAAVAITPDGSTAYVASSLPNVVTPIQIATDTAGTPIHAGTFPLAIAFISG